MQAPPPKWHPAALPPPVTTRCVAMATTRTLVATLPAAAITQGTTRIAPATLPIAQTPALGTWRWLQALIPPAAVIACFSVLPVSSTRGRRSSSTTALVPPTP
eukprot:TRINITY_DN18398_c0_g1_i1.p3 TRINITY_DN18398_c0_g1~~TRINITY_DN18398_c0_g1_i1.p3  ORF type:complete len:103 (+),score=9.18 TRINITY_DN18398_c0_g1_i1:349-657(+)